MSKHEQRTALLILIFYGSLLAIAVVGSFIAWGYL